MSSIISFSRLSVFVLSESPRLPECPKLVDTTLTV